MIISFSLLIRRETLKVLSVLLSNNDECKEDIRENGMLKHLVKIIENYPSDDVRIEVLNSALITLSHSVTQNPNNQIYLNSTIGLEGLSKQFSKFVKAFTSATALEIFEDQKNVTETFTSAFHNLCLTLQNLCFGNEQNQISLLKTGVLSECVKLLNFVKTYSPNISEETISDLLNVLVNSSDTNTEVQDYFSITSYTELISYFLSHIELKVCGFSALWLSHLVFNSKNAQQIFGIDEIIQKLLKLADFALNQDSIDFPQHQGLENSFYSLLALINLSYQQTSIQVSIFNISF
jgi:hypothetical protein